MKNIFILDTNKESYLYSMGDGKLYISDLFEKGSSAWKNKFIYITNQDKCKKGDWVIWINNENLPILWKVNSKITEHLQLSSSYDIWVEKENIKKVCLTNDTSLIEDGVQAVDSLLLSFYAEKTRDESFQPDYVEVTREKDGQYFDHYPDGTVTEGIYENYSLNFPQEKDKTEEKLYTKKDLEKAFNQGCAYTIGSHELFKQTHLSFEEWFKQI